MILEDGLERAGGLTATQAASHLPGEAGTWVFIGGEAMVFSLFFSIFLHDFGFDPALFRASQAHLNQTVALVNTILLLSSSWLVATAVEAARRNTGPIASVCFASALICGLGFCVIKFFEYREKLAAGITVNTNAFWTFYFMYTGIHLLHVLIGLGVLTFLMHLSRKGVFDSRRLSHIESGASYWHLVDLLWIGLFALLYLVK